jgi:hypothetical protein
MELVIPENKFEVVIANIPQGISKNVLGLGPPKKMQADQIAVIQNIIKNEVFITSLFDIFFANVDVHIIFEIDIVTYSAQARPDSRNEKKKSNASGWEVFMQVIQLLKTGTIFLLATNRKMGYNTSVSI